VTGRALVLAGALAVPLAGLALVLAAPSADVHWEHHPAHFWLVLAAAALSAVLAVTMGAAARRRGDPRVYLVSLAFLAASGFLALHALATPGVLLEESNVGFAISTPIGLVIASGFAAASALELTRSPRTIARIGALQKGLVGVLAVWAVVSLTLLPDASDPAVPERGSWALALPAAAAIGLYGFAVVRYLRLYARRRSGLLLSVAAAFVLLAEAAVATAASRNWRASWWEWHVLMLVAVGLVALAARREWHEERYSPLYLDETAEGDVEVSILFADLAGFTAFAEQHEPAVVTAMLNEYFEAVVPEVERHGGDVDRLIGDAIMVVFNRRRDQPDHAQRAARAALAFQRAAGEVAARQPDWPRFRAGVNTGRATVGVLGAAGGRTYSVVGDAVNVASRVEGLAPEGGVAVAAGTAERLSGARLEPLGTMAVKGRREPVEVHLLLEPPR
jgi:class 3 adenylate cyclase